MPGKKGFITSKDYQAPLRRPGKKRDTLSTQDGGKDSSSATSESDKGEKMQLVLQKIFH